MEREGLKNAATQAVLRSRSAPEGWLDRYNVAGDVRGRGLIGIEIVEDGFSRKQGTRMSDRIVDLKATSSTRLTEVAGAALE